MKDDMKAFCPILGRFTLVEPTLYCRDDWQIVRCTETGFVFLKDPPPYEMLEETLAWEVAYSNEKLRRRQAEPIANRLSWIVKRSRRFLFPNRNRFLKLALSYFRRHTSFHSSVRVVDIGCGHGGLLSQFHKRFSKDGWNVELVGIEVSKRLAAQATILVEPLGGKVIESNAISGANEIEPCSVDLVVMSSFLEHEARPLQLLRTIHRTLGPSGVIVLKVPNFASLNRHLRGSRWCGFRYPDHVNYFTPSTLRTLAHEAGFNCHQSVTDALPFSDSMYALLTKNSLMVNASPEYEAWAA